MIPTLLQPVFTLPKRCRQQHWRYAWPYRMDPGGVQTPSYRNIAENEKEGIQARWSPFEPLLHVKIPHFDNVTFTLSQLSQVLHFCHKCHKCHIVNDTMETLDTYSRTCWKDKPQMKQSVLLMRIGHLDKCLEYQCFHAHIQGVLALSVHLAGSFAVLCDLF